jgi:transposase
MSNLPDLSSPIRSRELGDVGLREWRNCNNALADAVVDTAQAAAPRRLAAFAGRCTLNRVGGDHQVGGGCNRARLAECRRAPLTFREKNGPD